MDPSIIWDDEDDEEGNYHHIVTEGHGITQEEVDEVLREHYSEATTSRTTGNPNLLRLDTNGQVHRGRLRGIVRQSADALPDHSLRGPSTTGRMI
jgi:hypothetical protein